MLRQGHARNSTKAGKPTGGCKDGESARRGRWGPAGLPRFTAGESKHRQLPARAVLVLRKGKDRQILWSLGRHLARAWAYALRRVAKDWHRSYRWRWCRRD